MSCFSSFANQSDADRSTKNNTDHSHMDTETDCNHKGNGNKRNLVDIVKANWATELARKGGLETGGDTGRGTGRGNGRGTGRGRGTGAGTGI